MAALWGVFIWRDSASARGVATLLTLMFLGYISGLALTDRLAASEAVPTRSAWKLRTSSSSAA